MPRKYKSNPMTRRPSSRFHVTFDAPIQPKPIRTCEVCSGKVEEVMSGKLCFSCNREQAYNKPAVGSKEWFDRIKPIEW
jgi:hypothetical protein